MVLLRWILILFMMATPGLAEESRTIAVTGVGTVSATPDMVTIRAGVQTEDRRAAQALRDNSALVADVLKTLARFDVAPRDIQTTNLSLYPQYDNRSKGQGVGISHYVAQNIVTIRLRDIPRLGAILDAINEEGVNRIENISFGFQDDSALMTAARQSAVKDGLARAELYAGAAGVALGPLLSLNEAGASAPRPIGMARAESMAMDVPVAEGELAVRAQVNMVFGIE